MPGERPERILIYDRRFNDDLSHWILRNQRIAVRLLRLVNEIDRDPFRGTGKPEPLKHLGPNVWSRRLTDEDRLVYVVEHDRITFLQARHHYSR